MRYPRTPYLPSSPSQAPGDRVIENVDAFLGVDVVVTEKLDGSCLCLHNGVVYPRSGNIPHHAPWLGMVKAYHAWKLAGDERHHLFGEDIYGIHSIEYNPVAPDQTFYAFAMVPGNGHVTAWDDMASFANKHGIPVVPVLFRGYLRDAVALRALLVQAHASPSVLGGTREGVVIRLAKSFNMDEFAHSVAKSVRLDHVQTDEHWTRHWRPCQLIN